MAPSRHVVCLDHSWITAGVDLARLRWRSVVRTSTSSMSSNLARKHRTARLAVGSIKVVSATVQSGEDAAGEPAVFFDVVLPTPEPESGTWPIDDVLELHDEIDRKARQLRMPSAWHVRLLPETEPEADAEDTND